MDKGNSVVTQEDARAWMEGNNRRPLSCEQAFMAGACLAAHRIASTTTAQATIDELRGALEALLLQACQSELANDTHPYVTEAFDRARTILARTGDA